MSTGVIKKYTPLLAANNSNNNVSNDNINEEDEAEGDDITAFDKPQVR